MKKIVFILVVVCAFATSAGAQYYTPINTYYEYARTRFKDMLRPPLDTLPGVDVGSIAIKGGVIYVKTASKWMPAGAASIDGAQEADPVFAASAAFGITPQKKAEWDAKQSAIATGLATQYLRGDLSLGNFYTAMRAIGDTAYAAKLHPHTASQISDLLTAVRNMFSSGSGIVYDAATGKISATASVDSSNASNWNFTNGLEKTGNEVKAKYLSPIWNANRIQSYYVDATTRARHGYFLGLDTATGVIRWMKADSLSLSNIYTKAEVDSLLGTGVDLSGYYNKAESDSRFDIQISGLADSSGFVITQNGVKDTVQYVGGAAQEGTGSGGTANLKRQQWKNSTATTYTLTSSANGSFAAVFLNGIELDSADYTVSGTTLTLLFTPRTADRISIHYTY